MALLAYIIAGTFDLEVYTQECRHPTFDLVGRLRYRRLTWLGELLRREEEYLVRRVVLVQLQQSLDGEINADGSIWMDAPKHNSTHTNGK